LAGALMGKTSKKTATEYALRKAKEDVLMSSLMRNIIEGEKDFWYRWLKRHQRFMSENDTKLVELTGFQGAKEFLELRKSEFIPQVDPKITIISSLEAEPQRIIKRRDLGEILPTLPQIGGNAREALRYMLFLTDLSPDQIEAILPQTPHEFKAEKENEILKLNKVVQIDSEDDDMQHISVHMRISSTEARELHIASHLANMLRKEKEKRNLEMMERAKGGEEAEGGIPAGEKNLPEEIPEVRMSTKTSEDILKQVLQSPQEGAKELGKSIIP